jgi:TolB-like protein
LLLPFESAGPAEKPWVAKALQQNLLAELSRVNSVQAITADQPAKNLNEAAKIAEGAGADFVVFGSYQAVDGDLRITGQVVDVAKRQAVAGLKATGTLRDLFGMEDVIANQVKRALPAAVAEAGPEMLKQPAAAAPIPGLDQQEPLRVNERAKALEDQIDRTIQRLRNSPVYGDDAYYSNSYFFSGIYSPYYAYPVYYYPVHSRRHCHPGYGYGLSVSGAYRGNHFGGTFRSGGGTISGGASANYANFGRMSIQPVRR